MSEGSTEQKILVDAQEAAALFSMGKSTFWREVKNKNVPAPVKIGGLTRWRLADLQRCAADLASQPTTASAHDA
jgi:predicted DNA-binding transcriptional regulator AlpA